MYLSYEVLRTAPLSETSTNLLRELQAHNVDVDFWKEAHPGMAAELMVGPGKADGIKQLLAGEGIDFTTKIADVGE